MTTAVNLANAASPSENPNSNSSAAGANSEVSAAEGAVSDTSRFKVEEVPNYEPILFTTSESGMTFSITFIQRSAKVLVRGLVKFVLPLLS